MDQRFDHGGIGLTTQGIQATNHVRDVVLEVGCLDQATIGIDEVIGFSIRDDHDAIATAAIGRLDHELRMIQ